MHAVMHAVMKTAPAFGAVATYGLVSDQVLAPSECESARFSEKAIILYFD
jgi:hypothetical protein